MCGFLFVYFSTFVFLSSPVFSLRLYWHSMCGIVVVSSLSPRNIKKTVIKCLCYDNAKIN